MFISPTKDIENKWVSGNITPECIQPNGIDFRLTRLFAPDVLKTNSFVLTNKHKTSLKYSERDTYKYTIEDDLVDGWSLAPMVCYDFASDIRLHIPNDVACLLFQRSTLNRNQVRISSGVWDSGFDGNIGGQIVNMHTTSCVLEQNVRVGQVVFIKAQAAKAYNGQYQNLQEHWSQLNKETKI